MVYLPVVFFYSWDSNAMPTMAVYCFPPRCRQCSEIVGGVMLSVSHLVIYSSLLQLEAEFYLLREWVPTLSGGTESPG